MEAYGFRERQTAERLRDFAGQLGNQPHPGMKVPAMGNSTGQHRAYWIVPKGTIPAATDEKTPGVGKGYICKLNREADPPTIERHKFAGEDVEVDVFNYTSDDLVEDNNDELSPLHRVYEDVFGELTVTNTGGGSTKVAYVQAPVGGLPPRTKPARPSKRECEVLVKATVNFPPYFLAGDFVRTGIFIDVCNWTSSVAAPRGVGIVQVDNHIDRESQVIGWDCNDRGNRNSIYDPDHPSEYPSSQYDPSGPDPSGPSVPSNPSNPSGSGFSPVSESCICELVFENGVWVMKCLGLCPRSPSLGDP